MATIQEEISHKPKLSKFTIDSMLSPELKSSGMHPFTAIVSL